MNDIKYTNEWLQLSRDGKFEQAQELYFSKLLPEICELFAEKYDEVLANDELLISILGPTIFSFAPIENAPLSSLIETYDPGYFVFLLPVLSR